uniref:GB1/RHD3-type G domain-containing protein n=1 Tax=Tetranychus urticae TaxID=32264 RepID=T1JZM7_TETUR
MQRSIEMALPITALEYNESGKKYEFDVTKFSEIASSDEIKDLPIAVVSIIGESRKGKSFLLNYFLRYLQRYDQEDWLGDPNEPLQGFLWTQGAESCTTGIVLWPEPLIVTRKDGTKIAVILMDTQGLFVDATEQEDCNYIFAISSFLSSIQVYNQQENILTNDITLLSRLAEYSKEKLKITGYKGIQKLLLLIRDWSANCVYPFGADGGKQFLDSKRNNQSQFHKDWQTIHDCYSQVDCFLMPHPGLQATRRGFEGEISKLDAHFTNVLRELVENLLSPENIVIKTNNGKEMKMWEFVAFFKNISENLQRWIYSL